MSRNPCCILFSPFQKQGSEMKRVHEGISSSPGAERLQRFPSLWADVSLISLATSVFHLVSGLLGGAPSDPRPTPPQAGPFPQHNQKTRRDLPPCWWLAPRGYTQCSWVATPSERGAQEEMPASDRHPEVGDPGRVQGLGPSGTQLLSFLPINLRVWLLSSCHKMAAAPPGITSAFQTG